MEPDPEPKDLESELDPAPKLLISTDLDLNPCEPKSQSELNSLGSAALRLLFSPPLPLPPPPLLTSALPEIASPDSTCRIESDEEAALLASSLADLVS